MKRLLLALALPLLALLGSIGPANASNVPQEASDREILVMLKLPPPHYRPNGSYSGGYGDAQSKAARRRVALQIARENRLELVDSWPMPLLGIDCYVMRLPPGVSAEEAIAKVSRHRMVEWSQPMNLYRANGGGEVATDPLLRASPAATSWRLADLHRIATGRGVSVAVIDSKVDVDHPDLSGQFEVSKDFVARQRALPEGHGTQVAGVIAAKAKNGIGSAGIAPGARLMALRACWQTGPTAANPTLCSSLSLARAIEFAINHRAEVINLSVSGPSDLLLQKLIALALARRSVVVAAYDATLPGGGFPASQPGVIAVVDDSLRKIPAKLYGAPGRNVPTTQPGGRWNLVSGSSFAAAHVSGLVALVREKQPSTKIVLVRSANGAVDACTTMLRAWRDCDCACAQRNPLTSAGQR